MPHLGGDLKSILSFNILIFLTIMLLMHVKSFGMLLQRNRRLGQGFRPFQSKIAVTSERFPVRTFSQKREHPELIADDEKLITESASTASIRQQLVDFRKKAALKYNKPAYIIFTNKVLELMLESIPKSAEGLKGVYKEVYPEILDILSGGIGSSGTDSSVLATSITDSSSPPILSSYYTNTLEREEIIAAPSWISLSSLSVEQQHAAQIVLSGQNVFITGSAGTGKSYLLKYIVQEMRRKFEEMAESDDTISARESVVITAPTGVAAINVGGCTIHSFAGIGLGEGTSTYLKNKVLRNSNALKRWQNCKVLIIDEVSMLSTALFEVLDLIARTAKRSNKPFGGLQLICVGDFMQLPPVIRREQSMDTDDQDPIEQRKFCFQSPIWKATGLTRSEGGTLILDEVIRQKNDQVFVSVLNEIRKGQLSKETADLLKTCLVSKKALPADGIIPTKLYCVNRDVDNENMKRLSELAGESYTIKAIDVWKTTPSSSSLKKTIIDGINKNIQPEIELKIGAQVMLLRNKSAKLVNGSRGVVEKIVESSPGIFSPVVRFDSGEVVRCTPVETEYNGLGGDGALIRNQVPLKLAWAITVHKCQGTTLTRAELMIQNTFEYGQAYVALSRVTGLGGLWLTRAITQSSVKADPAALEYYGYSTFDDIQY
mmetsp:Transcript_33576/g.32054  ORF Transcript_33576/g.32054 Transcript_33576/m.32054 type:complete len:659 (+) Transcript_33576:83-2059(+)